MLHPFHLRLEIQVKGTGMFFSPRTDSATLALSVSTAISLLVGYFDDIPYIKPNVN